MLFLGPTGVGKSVWMMQAMIYWALGSDFMGIRPARPLKFLLIQAENDEMDLAEMCDSVVECLNLSKAQANEACDRIRIVTESAYTASAFASNVLKPAVSSIRPDIVVLDPVLSYLGGESNSQRDVGSFLRNLITPVLQEFDCGAIVVHHTNKPASGKEKKTWTGTDLAYLGNGSSEWANWARGILAIQSLGEQQLFLLAATKRGRRLAWVEDDGEPRYEQLMQHAKERGRLFWSESTVARKNEEFGCNSGAKTPPDPEKLVDYIPAEGAIVKSGLVERTRREMAIGKNRAAELVKEAIGLGLIFEGEEPRPNARPRKMVARTPFPEKETEEKPHANCESG